MVHPVGSYYTSVLKYAPFYDDEWWSVGTVPRTLNIALDGDNSSRERTDVTQSRPDHNGNRVFRAAAGCRTLDQSVPKHRT